VILNTIRLKRLHTLRTHLIEISLYIDVYFHWFRDALVTCIKVENVFKITIIFPQNRIKKG